MTKKNLALSSLTILSLFLSCETYGQQASSLPEEELEEALPSGNEEVIPGIGNISPSAEVTSQQARSSAALTESPAAAGAASTALLPFLPKGITATGATALPQQVTTIKGTSGSALPQKGVAPRIQAPAIKTSRMQTQPRAQTSTVQGSTIAQAHTAQTSIVQTPAVRAQSLQSFIPTLQHPKQQRAQKVISGNRSSSAFNEYLTSISHQRATLSSVNRGIERRPIESPVPFVKEGTTTTAQRAEPAVVFSSPVQRVVSTIEEVPPSIPYEGPVRTSSREKEERGRGRNVEPAPSVHEPSVSTYYKPSESYGSSEFPYVGSADITRQQEQERERENQQRAAIAAEKQRETAVAQQKAAEKQERQAEEKRQQWVQQTQKSLSGEFALFNQVDTRLNEAWSASQDLGQRIDDAGASREEVAARFQRLTNASAEYQGLTRAIEQKKAEINRRDALYQKALRDLIAINPQAQQKWDQALLTRQHPGREFKGVVKHYNAMVEFVKERNQLEDRLDQVSSRIGATRAQDQIQALSRTIDTLNEEKRTKDGNVQKLNRVFNSMINKLATNPQTQEVLHHLDPVSASKSLREAELRYAPPVFTALGMYNEPLPYGAGAEHQKWVDDLRGKVEMKNQLDAMGTRTQVFHAHGDQDIKGQNRDDIIRHLETSTVLKTLKTQVYGEGTDVNTLSYAQKGALIKAYLGVTGRDSHDPMGDSWNDIPYIEGAIAPAGVTSWDEAVGRLRACHDEEEHRGVEEDFDCP